LMRFDLHSVSRAKSQSPSSEIPNLKFQIPGKSQGFNKEL
jgi:hypothetical protein